ncbi:MAG: SpoIVB peptidase S55 domain-containing protein [Nocardioides sp.]|nr:SpoIVB peptidase S55 domain-containing protein [Nocardioides sp.]
MGLLLGATALTSGPAGSAEPAGDCTDTFPLAGVTKGQSAEGLTVSSGVTPEPFTGEVLGVLESGIAPGLDMVIMDLDSPAIQAAGGIWQGMSGSPVYDATDGRLIGAVAYGLAWGSSPVTGITPFEDMDDYLAEAAGRPGRVPVGKTLAQRIARHSDVTAAQAAQGLRQLPMPLGISGVRAQRLDSAQARPYLSKRAYAVGTSGVAGNPTAEDIVAGGNIAASQSFGDITAAGVGTATQVCDGRVVGFGHPMTFSGDSTMSMHPADALYIQEDPLGAPFKVANLGDPVGTITDDRLTGITGSFGVLPDSMTVTSEVTSGDRSREGTTHVTVPMAAAEVTFYQLIGNHDRVIDGVMPGTETQTWTIKGTDAKGVPFTAAFTDRYTSTYDITFEASYDLPDLVYGMSQLPGVTVDEVTHDAVVTKSTARYAVGAVQQYRQGAWVTLGKKEPARVKAGRKLILRSVLTGPSGPEVVTTSFTVPKRAKGKKGAVAFTGGNELYSEAAYQNTLAKILAGIKANARNDQVQVNLGIFGGKTEIAKTQVRGPVDLVVTGSRRVRLIVE